MKKLRNICTKLISLLAITLLIITGCKKEIEPNPQVEYIEYVGSEGVIGAGGGKLTFSDQSSPINGVSVDIPKGAIRVTW